MRRIAVFAVAVAAAAAAIIFAVRSDESRPFVEGEEWNWIRIFEAWLADAYDVLDDVRARSELDERTSDQVESCADVSSSVRPPPTERLRTVHEQVLEACAELRSFAAARQRDAVRADEHWRRADDLLTGADDDLYAILGYTGPLPEAGDALRRLPRVEPRLARVASDWVGFPVDVRCFPEREWVAVAAESDAWYGDFPEPPPGGFADVDYDRIVLGPACELLSDFDGEWEPSLSEEDGIALADAIGLLAHEIAHLDDGDLGEAEAECAAVQRLAWTARQLGASAAYARGLARTYWREWYPENDEEYLSDECRDGGGLDEHPGTSVWP